MQQLSQRIFTVQTILQISIALMLLTGVFAVTGIVAYGLNPDISTRVDTTGYVAGVEVARDMQIEIRPLGESRDSSIVSFDQNNVLREATAIVSFDRVLGGATLLPFVEVTNPNPEAVSVSFDNVMATNVQDALKLSFSTSSNFSSYKDTVIIPENSSKIITMRIQADQSINFPFTITVNKSY